jgi:hypothetical protein
LRVVARGPQEITSKFRRDLMSRLAFRSVVGGLALGVLGIVVVGCASKMHSKPVDASIMPKLAGKYTGYYTDAGGNATPANLTVDDKGNYRMIIINSDITNSGTVSVVDGQLVFKRTARTGPSQDRAFATGTVDVQEAPDGAILLSGFGHDDVGPLSVSFTKRK